MQGTQVINPKRFLPKIYCHCTEDDEDDSCPRGMGPALKLIQISESSSIRHYCVTRLPVVAGYISMYFEQLNMYVHTILSPIDMYYSRLSLL